MFLLGLAPPPGAVPVHFRDIGPQAGLTTVRTSDDTRYLIETMGGEQL